MNKETLLRLLMILVLLLATILAASTASASGPDNTTVTPSAPTAAIPAPPASAAAPASLQTVRTAPAIGNANESLPLGPAPTAAGIDRTPGAITELQGSTLSQLWPLVVVLAIILGAAWFVRKMAKGDPGLVAAMGAGGRSPAGVLEVLGRYPVARNHSFVLLRLDRRVLLLSQSFGKHGTGFSTLAELTEPEDVASILLRVNQAEGKSMESYLNEAMQQMERQAPAAHASATSDAATDRVEFSSMIDTVTPQAQRPAPRASSLIDGLGAALRRPKGGRS
jgi:flagellar biogenesis protein FliO